MGVYEVCTARSTTSGLRVPLNLGIMVKGWLSKVYHKVNGQCYDYDLYNTLYVCLFLYRFKNWGFESFIRETKGPSSTSAS